MMVTKLLLFQEFEILIFFIETVELVEMPKFHQLAEPSFILPGSVAAVNEQ